MTTRVAFLQHSEWDAPGGLSQRARALGMATIPYRADRGPEGLPTAGSFDLLVVLGSAASTEFSSPAWVAPERDLVATAVGQGVPVLGVCFGGQMLAQVLGARITRAPEPEIGWRLLATDDPETIPPGPWVSWHGDQFDAPPGAEVVARTGHSLQAFIAGVHTGLQFHPEVDAGIVGHWLDDDLPEGKVNPEQAHELRDGFAVHGRAATAQADQLFDGFVARAGIPL